MRITIESDGEEVKTSTGESGTPSGQGAPGTSAPPGDVAARAAAEGALSAGPAPAELSGEETVPFTSGPGTPETTPESRGADEGDQSAGAAPGFAADVTEVDVEEES
jgi:hypothetical protein